MPNSKQIEGKKIYLNPMNQETKNFKHECYLWGAEKASKLEGNEVGTY